MATARSAGGDLAGRLSWDDLKIFAHVCEHKTFERAARSLGISPATVGRHIGSLEQAINAPVFKRGSAALTLTEMGSVLFSEAQKVTRNVEDLMRSVHAAHARQRGSVRITSIDWLSHTLLPTMTLRVRRKYDEIIEIIGTNEVLDLAKGEADISVRFRPFDSLDVVQKRLCELKVSLYASDEYIQNFGRIADGCLMNHRIGLLHDGASQIPEMQWMHERTENAIVAFKSTCSLSLLKACEAGLCVVMLPRLLAVNCSTIKEVWRPTDIRCRHIWLGVRRERARQPVARAIAETFAKELRSLARQVH